MAHDPLQTRQLPDPKEIYNHLKSSAKKRHIEFTLTVLDIYDLAIPLTCPIFGFPLYWHRSKFHDDSYSVDRINTELGYVPGNLQYISYLANRCKNSMTDEELQLFCEHYIKPK